MGDDADLRSAHFHPVHRRRLGVLRESLRAGFNDGMALDCIAGHHDVLRDVLFVSFLRNGALPGLHHGLGMGDPGTHLQKNRCIELLRDLISQFRKFQGLGGIRRLQHGNLGRDGVMAAVLLVLGGMHARIIRDADDESRVHTGVGHGVKRVRRHIQSHMLHCAERTLSGQAGAEGRLHGHFFVRSPLTVDLVVLYGFFGDLRTGSSRVAGDKAASRLEETAGNGLVAQHQLSHSNSLLLCIIIQCLP